MKLFFFNQGRKPEKKIIYIYKCIHIYVNIHICRLIQTDIYACVCRKENVSKKFSRYISFYFFFYKFYSLFGQGKERLLKLLLNNKYN